MEKVVKKINAKSEDKENLKYWNSKTDEERISAIQVLREQYIRLYNKIDEYNVSRKRLRRFYGIIKQAQS